MTEVLSRITPEGWLGIGLSAIVMYLYVDHLVHAVRSYLAHRGARRLRGAMLALLLAAGMLGILMGIVSRYVPDAGDAARFIRWISVGLLLVGGVVTWISWRLPGGND